MYLGGRGVENFVGFSVLQVLFDCFGVCLFQVLLNDVINVIMVVCSCWGGLFVILENCSLLFSGWGGLLCEFM